MILRTIFISLIFAGLVCASPLKAEVPSAPQAFFTALQDVPVMPGLYELSDQAAAFDKPEGRIVETLAAIESISQEEVAKFYAATLPQLGWRPLGGQIYERENERLQLSFEAFEGRQYMKLMVGPKGL